MDTGAIEAFWHDTLERARKEPLDMTCEPVSDPLPHLVYRLSYRSWQGRTVKALLGLPIVPAGRTIPAIVTAPGYGGWEQGVTLSECQRGYAMLQVFPRDQGISGTSKPREPRTGPYPLMTGIERPEGYYYQGAYVDMIRGVDCLVARPEVDPARIGAMGTSQGGGLVLALASLDERVKAVVAHLPFLCGMRHNRAFKGSEIDKPEYMNTFDFFDPVNLASRCRSPALLSTGGKDDTSPQESIRAVFDRLGGIKSLAYYPDLPHTSCSDFYAASWQWMERYL